MSAPSAAAEGCSPSAIVSRGVSLTSDAGGAPGHVFAGRKPGGFVRLLFRDEFGRCRLGRRHRGLERLCGCRLVQPGLARRTFGRFVRKVFGGERFALHHVTIAMAIGPAMPMTTAPSGAVIRVRIGRALVTLFLRDQCLPVSDRNLVVVGMDFRERQKPVTVAAVIDESRLQGRFNPRDLGEVDVTAKLLAVGAFEIEFFDAVAA